MCNLSSRHYSHYTNKMHGPATHRTVAICPNETELHRPLRIMPSCILDVVKNRYKAHIISGTSDLNPECDCPKRPTHLTVDDLRAELENGFQKASKNGFKYCKYPRFFRFLKNAKKPQKCKI